MYCLQLARRFRAEHFLFGGDWGDENRPHTHDYRLELRLHGPELNQHGYLLDLLEVEALLERVIEQFAGRQLNQLEPFADLNPSIEHFARILASELGKGLPLDNRLARLEVRLWETETAWASYQCELPCR
jgi:6-pyruvoyltetrahydropterin/6-carboxytetrahydropterin synthase